MSSPTPCPTPPAPGPVAGLVCSVCGRTVHAVTYRWMPGGPSMVCDECLALAEPGRLEPLPARPWPPGEIPLLCTLCGRAPYAGAAELWQVRPDLGQAWCPNCLAGAPQA